MADALNNVAPRSASSLGDELALCELAQWLPKCFIEWNVLTNDIWTINMHRTHCLMNRLTMFGLSWGFSVGVAWYRLGGKIKRKKWIGGAELEVNLLLFINTKWSGAVGVLNSGRKKRVWAEKNMKEVREDVWLCLACMQQFHGIEIAQPSQIKSNTHK